MHTFFKDEFSYKRALKDSQSQDGRSYGINMNSVPLREDNINLFFEEWPQYKDFPLKDDLVRGTKAEQCDAILSLQEYTVYIDKTVFLF